MNAWDPLPDLAAAATLGTALRAVGYTTEVIEELLGEEGPSADLAESVVLERRLPRSAIATTIRLLLLQRPVGATDAAAALGPNGVAALLAIGLVTTDDGRLVPRARLVPAEGLYLAFDGFSRGQDDPPGWVVELHPDGLLARLADPAAPGRARARHRHGERRTRPARRRARGPRDRDRRERPRPGVHADQRGAERDRQRRDSARQPLRAGRGRDIRPDHLQRAVRHLSGAAVAVPRRRPPRRRALRARRA